MSSSRADGELAQSLGQLSINTMLTNAAASSPQTPRRHSSLSPAVHAGAGGASLNRASPSPSPLRGLSRSPSTGRESRSGSRSGTPTLLRKASTTSLRSVSSASAAHANGSNGHSNGRILSQPLSRRASSSHLVSSSPVAKSSPLGMYTSGPASASTSTLAVIAPEKPPEKPPATAAAVASEYFASELKALHGDDSTRAADTIVILHDDCYGHRFSRPRTSRAALNTIVERPERVRAGVLGVSLAYVRLGGRHADGGHPPHPGLDPFSTSSLPFRIHKSTRRVPLTSQAVVNVHGAKWMEELKMMCESAEGRLAMGQRELRRPDANRVPNASAERQPELHEGDLYLCAGSLAALEGSLGAVCDAVDTVFAPSSATRRAFVAVRPPGHHCSASYPSGFCWVNNVHVAVMHAALHHGLTHAAILDFDLHHGDGSQAIAWAHNERARAAAKNAAAWRKTSIGYFSLHDINSYPCESGDEEKVRSASLCIEGAHGQTVWNVHLQPWRSEADFWRLYEDRYTALLDRTRSYLRSHAERIRASPGAQAPRAAVFISAGFDASEWEGAGMQRHSVNVPTEFYARVTRDVVRIAHEEGTAAGGRVVSMLEGGYSDRALVSGICSHLCGMATGNATGQQAAGQRATDDHYFANGGGGVSSVVPGEGVLFSQLSQLTPLERDSSSCQYDPSWWSGPELDRLESTHHVAPQPTETRKSRHESPPTYSSPTQSSTARAVDPVKFRRSLSGLSSHASSSNLVVSRAPTPPPPDVPWVVAARELSRLLIPHDRPTESCKAEELGAEASRARRDRQSMLMTHAPAKYEMSTANAPTSIAAAAHDAQLVPPLPPPSRMGLRERKPVNYADEDERGKGRRKTVATSSLMTEKASAQGIASDATTAAQVQAQAQGAKRVNRRLSTASTLLAASNDPAIQAAMGIHPPRPPSVQSIRPESSMSVRDAPLPVKKTRTTVARREGGPKVIRGPKKIGMGTTTTATTGPSTNHAVRAETNTETVLQQPVEPVKPMEPVGNPGLPVSRQATSVPPTTGGGGDGLDKITTGMRKIKINLITKSKREALEKAASEAAAAAAAASIASAPPATVAGTETATATTADQENSVPTLESMSVPVGTSSSHRLPSFTSASDTHTDLSTAPITLHPTYPYSAFPTVDVVSTAAALPGHTTTDNSVTSDDSMPHHHPDGQPNRSSSNGAPRGPMSSPHGPQRWLPPNSSLGASPPDQHNHQQHQNARKSSGELPVFSSTGPIPFAPWPAGSRPGSRPESGIGSRPGSRGSATGSITSAGASAIAASIVPQGKVAAARTIWEIPETRKEDGEGF